MTTLTAATTTSSWLYGLASRFSFSLHNTILTLKKSIAIGIAILFPPIIAIAIAKLFASIANNPGHD